MGRVRLIVWLIALLAFVAPVSAAPMMAMQTAAMDCPHHAPPPDPCPHKDTAKHSAGTCCPLMSGAVALVPSTLAKDAVPSREARIVTAGRSLAGLIFTQDPPPPRV